MDGCGIKLKPGSNFYQDPCKLMYGFNPLKAIQIKFWLLLCSLTFDSTQMKGESKVKPHSDFHTCWCVAFCFLKKSQSAITVRDAVISCWFLPHAWLGSDLVQAFKKGEPLIVLDTQKRGPFFCIRGTLPQGYTHTHTDDPPHTHTPDTPYTHTHTHTEYTHTQIWYTHTHTHTHTDKQPLMLLTHFHEKLVPLVGLPQSLLHWRHHRGGGGGHAKTRIAETHNTS